MNIEDIIDKAGIDPDILPDEGLLPPRLATEMMPPWVACKFSEMVTNVPLGLGKAYASILLQDPDAITLIQSGQ